MIEYFTKNQKWIIWAYCREKIGWYPRARSIDEPFEEIYVQIYFDTEKKAIEKIKQVLDEREGNRREHE